MSIEAPLSRVESLLDYFIDVEVVPNTFGTIGQLREALERIDASTPTGGPEEELRERVRRVLTTIEDDRALFAIPEKYLVDKVYKAAERVRKKVGLEGGVKRWTRRNSARRSPHLSAVIFTGSSSTPRTGNAASSVGSCSGKRNCWSSSRRLPCQSCWNSSRSSR